MHVITKRRLKAFWQNHPSARSSLQAWYIQVKRAKWQSLAEVRRDFPAADQVQRLVVFNIGGNNYRLIARIEYAQQKLFIRAVLTHAEYARTGGKMTLGSASPTYEQLMLEFLPRPIKSEEEFEAVQREVDRLLDKGDLSSDEQDYLDLLGTLIENYEESVEDEFEYELHGIALIRGLLELHDLKQKDLVPIFKSKSIASAVLNGKRQLTVEHINKLAAFFRLPHELFFEPLNG